MHGHPFPGALKVNLPAHVYDPVSAACIGGHVPYHLLALLHNVHVISAGAVPFKECEFRQVMSSPLPSPVTFADLKDRGITSGEEPLHAQLRRWMQESISRSA